MSDREAERFYDRSIKQAVKSFGSYYTRTKIRQGKNGANMNIKTEKIESTDDIAGSTSWIVDNNINYESESDEKPEEENKRSSSGGH